MTDETLTIRRSINGLLTLWDVLRETHGMQARSTETEEGAAAMAYLTEGAGDPAAIIRSLIDMTTVAFAPETVQGVEHMLARVSLYYLGHGSYQHEPDATPLTHPDHPVVGRDVMGTSTADGYKTARFYCVSHDHCGYNLVNRGNLDEVKNVSERAIGGTFHIVHHDDYGGAREFCLWGPVLIDKNGQPRETGRIA